MQGVIRLGSRLTECLLEAVGSAVIVVVANTPVQLSQTVLLGFEPRKTQCTTTTSVCPRDVVNLSELSEAKLCVDVLAYS